MVAVIGGEAYRVAGRCHCYVVVVVVIVVSGGDGSGGGGTYQVTDEH